ncbi:MAG: formyltransferase family protein [Candidatus Stygibacter australis]|nr:formyltransferase family protein [Candidatus Stygibacter australis]MDP8321152.1 formyltransferase family protein [Candidatus Stygibacter australis]
MKDKIKLLIMISGRGSNMEAILRNTISGKLESLVEITHVFSNKEDAPGLETAEKLGFTTKVIISKCKKRDQYNFELKEWLEKIEPDYIILAGYMLIISSEIISLFPERIINIHPADTRQHQGLHGYEWAWRNKLSETMITIHYVDKGLDTGKIIAQKVVDLRNTKTLDNIEITGLKVEHELYSDVLAELFSK